MNPELNAKPLKRTYLMKREDDNNDEGDILSIITFLIESKTRTFKTREILIDYHLIGHSKMKLPRDYSRVLNFLIERKALGDLK